MKSPVGWKSVSLVEMAHLAQWIGAVETTDELKWNDRNCYVSFQVAIDAHTWNINIIFKFGWQQNVSIGDQIRVEFSVQRRTRWNRVSKFYFKISPWRITLIKSKYFLSFVYSFTNYLIMNDVIMLKYYVLKHRYANSVNIHMRQNKETIKLIYDKSKIRNSLHL